MKEYQLRVIAEKKELDKKITKLEVFLSLVEFDTVIPEERGLMVVQLTKMEGYSDTLRLRINTYTDTDD